MGRKKGAETEYSIKLKAAVIVGWKRRRSQVRSKLDHRRIRDQNNDEQMKEDTKKKT